MTDEYCKDHQRVKLQSGKCVACGELEYDLPKKRNSILKEVSFLAVLAIVGIIIFTIIAILTNS